MIFKKVFYIYFKKINILVYCRNVTSYLKKEEIEIPVSHPRTDKRLEKDVSIEEKQSYVINKLIQINYIFLSSIIKI